MCSFSPRHNGRDFTTAFFWNMLATITYACMFFLMTLMTVRLCGAETGGIFSIAFSSSQMMQTIAMFGMRNYQATDITEQFHFGEYISSRIITSAFMIIVCGLYGWMMHFDGEKLIIYLFFCGVKLFEALSDVFEGMLHQHNHLDLAAKGMFLRSFSIITVFIIALICSCQPKTASFFALLSSMLSFFLYSWKVACKVEKPKVSFHCHRIVRLILQCFPLFMIAVASSYISNAPKMAIELNMSDLIQGKFTIIFMPVLVISMVSGFIFKPKLNTMAVYYHCGEKKPFQKLIRIMLLVDLVITSIAFVGTYFLGVPILSWLYGVDIAEEKTELLLVIISGGICAMASLMSQALTALRQQRKMLIGNLLAAFISSISSTYLVRTQGIMGAVLSYFLSMLVLAGLLLLIYIVKMKKFEGDNPRI